MPLRQIVDRGSLGAASARQFQLLCRSSRNTQEHNLLENSLIHRRALTLSHGSSQEQGFRKSRHAASAFGQTNNSTRRFSSRCRTQHAIRQTRAASTTNQRKPIRPSVIPKTPNPTSASTPTTPRPTPPAQPPSPLRPLFKPPQPDTKEQSTVPPILVLEGSGFQRPKSLYAPVNVEQGYDSIYHKHSPQPSTATSIMAIVERRINEVISSRFLMSVYAAGFAFIMAIVFSIGEAQPKDRERGVLGSKVDREAVGRDGANADVSVIEAKDGTVEVVPLEQSLAPVEALIELLDPLASANVDSGPVTVNTESSDVQQTPTSRSQSTEDGQGQRTEAGKFDPPTSNWTRRLKFW